MKAGHELLTLEAEYACFNARRTLSRPNTGSARWTFRGDQVLIENADWPENGYVNRITTFAEDLERIARDRPNFNRIDWFHPAETESSPATFAPAMRKFNSTTYFHHELRTVSGIVATGVRVELCRDASAFIAEIEKSMDSPIDSAIVRAKRALYCTKNFRGYFARVDGVVAGLATLYIHERAGWLANAYTAPAFRKRGVQSELLRYRVEEGRNLGLAFAYTDALTGSDSARNVLRAGFKAVATADIYEKS